MTRTIGFIICHYVSWLDLTASRCPAFLDVFRTSNVEAFFFVSFGEFLLLNGKDSDPFVSVRPILALFGVYIIQYIGL